MASSASEARFETRNRMVSQAKDKLMDNAAVWMAFLGALLAAFAMLFGGIAMYVSYDATQDAERTERALALTNVYLQEVHVLIESEGIELPPLPEYE